MSTKFVFCLNFNLQGGELQPAATLPPPACTYDVHFNTGVLLRYHISRRKWHVRSDTKRKICINLFLWGNMLCQKCWSGLRSSGMLSLQRTSALLCDTHSNSRVIHSFIHFFSILEIHPSGYRTCHSTNNNRYIVIVMYSRNT